MAPRLCTPIVSTCVALAALCGFVLTALGGAEASEPAARPSATAEAFAARSPKAHAPAPPTTEAHRSMLTPASASWRRGVVVDVRGEAVAAVAIVRQLGEERFALDSSDAAGRFDWPEASGAGELWVEHTDWVCVRGARVDAARSAEARTLIVAPSTSIVGFVRSAGMELAGARVAVSLKSTAAAAPTWAGAGAHTHEGGRFELARIPGDTPLTIRVSHPNFVARSFCFDSAPRGFLVLELDPQPAPFGLLRGVVLTHTGAPAGADTSVAWGLDAVRCEADGSFELPLRHDPADGQITVRARGVSDSHAAPAWEQVRSLEPVVLSQGPPLEVLIGWVQRADGAGELKRCVVELHREREGEEPLARTRADANGRYEFRGLERGEYWVRAQLDGASASAGPIPSGGRAPELRITP